MYTINHSIEFQPRGTVSGLSDESPVELPKTLATLRRTARSANVLRLDVNKLADIRNGRRVSNTCLEGVLWVTEDWNPAADRISLAIRVVRARSQASHPYLPNALRRAPMPYC